MGTGTSLRSGASPHSSGFPDFDFLERVASGHRNLGVEPGDRALNFCWPLVGPTVASAADLGMEIETINVERNLFCPQGQDRWDIVLTFFKSMQSERSTRRAYRFTVDVSDVLPVLVAGPIVWSLR